MGKYNYMNLNQKMIRIRKKVPKLIRNGTVRTLLMIL